MFGWLSSWLLSSFLFLTRVLSLELNAPVDVYSEWIDACETVAQKDADEQLGRGSKHTADDRNFSTYGTGDDGRQGVVGAGDDGFIDDDDF